MIEVLRCGHDSRHTHALEMIHRAGIDHHLLLLIKSKAYVETENGIAEVFPGTAVLFDKNKKIRYGSREQGFNDDWIHFAVSPEDPVLSMAQIPFGIPFTPLAFSDISQYVRLLVRERYLSSEWGPAIQDSLMRALLLKLKEQRQENPSEINRYYPALTKLREEILNAPGRKWEIPEIADRLHMSVSYFQHLYKTTFGLPCKKDIILARLSNSKFYLTETDMDISAVASFCGYEDEIHYMKQFKKFEGMTPSQYRKLTLSSPHSPYPPE